MSQIIPNYSSHTDGDLLGLLQKTDTLALAELYSRYRHEIYRYALTLVKVPEYAEDLVQDVFIKLWDARERLDIKQHFRGYLFRIAHNAAVDLNKRIATSRQLTDALVYHYQTSISEEALSQEQLLRYDVLIEQALSSLSPQRRRVYELCKKQQKSYDEVARELGISTNTVKAHITQTLSFLRSYIAKHGDIPILLLLLKKFF